MKTILDCVGCGNPRPDKDGRCKCGRFVRQAVDCDICGYRHKLRSREFCRALHSKEGLDSLDNNKFLAETMELVK